MLVLLNGGLIYRFRIIFHIKVKLPLGKYNLAVKKKLTSQIYIFQLAVARC